MDYHKLDSELASSHAFKGLVEMGLRGFFPIFHPSWFLELNEVNNISENIIKKISEKLKNHKSFERKQTILMALPRQERAAFINAFVKIIEHKILDKGFHLQ